MFKNHLNDTVINLALPQVMGILNITPDSFFADSRTEVIDLAVKKAQNMVTQGAGILDIGGQSTRPGATIITIDEEIKRVVPIIEAIHAVLPSTPISIDTYHSKVAQAAIVAGASIVNDISCGNFDEKMIDIVVSKQVGYIGMHQTGTSSTMHQIEQRNNIIENLIQYFTIKKAAFAAKGLTEWIIDPGFGFSKTTTENFTIVKSLAKLKSLDLPILLGVSRKSSIYRTLGVEVEAALNGTTVLNTIGLMGGANILRVHDVKEAKEAILLVNQINA